MEHASLYASATYIAEMIRTREWSSREVVDAHIRKVVAVNPTINAVVAQRFEAARAEADAVDRVLDERSLSKSHALGEQLPPLYGVPCTIKEAIALEGMPHTSGLLARRGRISPTDATAVARLRKAGAIALGVTNVSELCMWMESNNFVYGRTSNAYKTDRTCGGSSGGEGAIVGVGASPFGLGSDIGGSIRMPAFFNGVFGHKPSGAMVPLTGQFPSPSGRARRMHSTGPLCRRAEDLYPLLKIIAGADGIDPDCVDLPLHDPKSVRMDALRVIVADEPCPMYASASLRASVTKTADALAAMGAKVEHHKLPRLRRALELWAACMHEAGGPSFASMLGEGTPIRGGIEFLKGLFGRSNYTVPAAGLAFIEKLPALLPDTSAKSLADTQALRQELDQLLGDDGVLLFPPHAQVAPIHGRALWLPIRFGFTAVFNAVELPVTAVPCGLDNDGVPLGVQVVGAYGRDHLTIAAAQALETACGGWVAPGWCSDGKLG
jgi:fatty acid amide hydrolase 2